MCHLNITAALLIILLPPILTIICHSNQLTTPPLLTKHLPLLTKPPHAYLPRTNLDAPFDDKPTRDTRPSSVGESFNTFARWNKSIKDNPAAVSAYISTTATPAPPPTNPSAPASYSAKKTTFSTKNVNPEAPPSASICRPLRQWHS